VIADIRKSRSPSSTAPASTRCCSADGAIRFRLPSPTVRAHLRNVEARSDDFVLPEIFELDATMEAALLQTNGGFSDVSVLDAVASQRQ
jgi:hypothetical protein